MIAGVVGLTTATVASIAALSVAPIVSLIEAVETLIDVVNVIVDVNKVLNDPASEAGLFSFSPLWTTLGKNLSETDVTNINNSPTALHIGFTSLDSGRYRFADQSWKLVDLITAVQASSTQPVFFPAIPMGISPTGLGTYQVDAMAQSENYVDGGVRSVVAVSPAIRKMKNPTTGKEFHLNIIIVFACSNLLELSSLDKRLFLTRIRFRHFPNALCDSRYFRADPIRRRDARSRHRHSGSICGIIEQKVPERI